ncbi:unnamed protein product [Cylindrotheca closterium]|uniref:CobW C-terminal domain-containing protein n=1 Tax=Cylindrotheca closterium TaxID=2856 RepID=A0AAD2G3U2_9STRA|nr:unnamed protein product [Cylindrotheca closterium]
MAKRTSPLSNTINNSDNSSKNNKNKNKKRKKNKNKPMQNDAPPPPPPIPVTVLSGFLGSGKTTLMKHILTSMDHGLKIAMIVNDMAELDIDGKVIQSAVVVNKPEVVTLQNGCICCNLRGDLIREIYRIQQLGQFDYVLIESTGIAEPQQVAESFCVDPETMELAVEQLTRTAGDNDNTPNVTGKMLLNAANLDTCVTVVDALHFPKYLSSLERFKDIFDDGLDQAATNSEEEGEKSISQLMIEQVEFANVIVLNKTDMVSSEKELNTSRALIKTLNPKAKVITASHGQIDVKEILNTGLFDLGQASESPGWLLSLKEHGVSGAPGEADEYGVTSFVYKNRSPFHPFRLYKFLRQFFCFANEWNASSPESSVKKIGKDDQTKAALNQKYGRILRSKGNCWLAGRDRHIYDWAQTGQIMALQPGQPWFCTLPAEEWGISLSIEDMKAIKDSFYGQDAKSGKKIPHDFGDRQSVVVLIGTDLKQEAITQALNDCCLSEEELKAHTTDLPYGSYADPLQPNEVVECDGVRSLFMVARHGQDQHFHVPRGSSFTIQNLSLLFHPVKLDYNLCYMVRVWLDKTDVTKRGVLLATLRAPEYEQHSMCMTILPCDVNGGEMDSNRRLRVEVIVTAKDRTDPTLDLMQLCEVHIVGKVEPLPFSEDDEMQAQEAMTDEDTDDANEDDEACKRQ